MAQYNGFLCRRKCRGCSSREARLCLSSRRPVTVIPPLFRSISPMYPSIVTRNVSYSSSGWYSSTFSRVIDRIRWVLTNRGRYQETWLLCGVSYRCTPGIGAVRAARGSRGQPRFFFFFFFFLGYVANQEKGGLRGEENEHNTFGYVRERNAKNLWHDWSNFLCTHMILSNKVGVRPPCASVFSSISWSFSAAFSTGRLWWFPVVYSHVAARFCRV